MFEERTNPNEYGHGIRKKRKNKKSKEKKVGTKHKANVSKEKNACDYGDSNGHVHYRCLYKYCNERSQPTK